MKRLLFLFATLSLVQLSSRSQSVHIEGTVLGSDERILEKAHATVYPMRLPWYPVEIPKAVLKSEQVLSDGRFGIDLDTSGVFQLWFTGVDHEPLKTAFLAQPGASVTVDARLAPRRFSDSFKPALIGPFNNFSPYTGYVEMHLSTDGTYLAVVPSGAADLTYQVIDAGTGPNQREPFNGTSGIRYDFDGWGSYKSIVQSGGDSTLITFDSRLLPQNPNGPSVIFSPDSSSAARFEDFWSFLNHTRDDYYRRIRELQADGATGEEIQELRERYDWSSTQESLRNAFRQLPDPALRSILFVTYLNGAGAIDSVIAQTTLAELSPDAAEWSLGYYTMVTAGTSSGREEAYENKYLATIREHRDPQIKPPLLWRLFRLADERGEAGRAQVLYEWLLSEYPRSYEARRVRAEFGLAVGDPAPPFQLASLSNPEATFTNDSFGGPTLLDFWATWCSPCIAEMPFLHEAFDRFAALGLSILSVSFDATRADVEDFLDRSAWTMPWNHAYVGEDWSSEIVKAYRISGLPRTVLLDDDGRIVAFDNDLRGERLSQTLETVFAKE